MTTIAQQLAGTAYGAKLTAAEWEALTEAALGHGNDASAGALGMSTQLLKNRLSSAYDKLGATSLIEALLLTGVLVPANAVEIAANDAETRLARARELLRELGAAATELGNPT